jgi:hypothetical protein
MGGFTEKARANLKFYPSFMFSQWAAIPIPIYLEITRWVFESPRIDSIRSSLGNSARVFRSGYLSIMVD